MTAAPGWMYRRETAGDTIVLMGKGGGVGEPIRHSWELTPAEAIELQRRLAAAVEAVPLSHAVRMVAGVDCALFDRNRMIVSAAVLMDAATMQVVATAHEAQPVRFPYVPGLLSFREAPAEIAALERLPQRPDLVMVDGVGIAHPRRLGIASHVGLWLDLPTVGVAKSRLVGRHEPVGEERGACAQLFDGGQVVGAVLRTREKVKPVYVSVGHRITLEEALRWTLRLLSRYRLPEPTRAAHNAAAEWKKRR